MIDIGDPLDIAHLERLSDLDPANWRPGSTTSSPTGRTSGGDPERVLTKNEMLDDISLHWFTGTATSGARLYWRAYHDRLDSLQLLRARRDVVANTNLSEYAR